MKRPSVRKFWTKHKHRTWMPVVITAETLSSVTLPSWDRNDGTEWTTAATTGIWTTWVDDAWATQTTAANTFVWRSWLVEDDAATGPAVTAAPAIRLARHRDADRFEAQLAAELAEHEVRVAAQDGAAERARLLLRSMLTEAQRQQLDTSRYFDVLAHGSQRRYRIHLSTHGNVRLLDGDREVVRYCAQPNGVPTHDAMLAQKLQIEHDEAGFLQVANATPIRVPA